MTSKWNFKIIKEKGKNILDIMENKYPGQNKEQLFTI